MEEGRNRKESEDGETEKKEVDISRGRYLPTYLSTSSHRESDR